jgi:UTP--glucose-1-phosphate uridylyltransferase
MVRKAVIPAAGFGTRFLPATKSQPKEMLPVVDTPTIQYVVDEAIQSGITDILMIIGKGKRAIEEHFDRNFELEWQLEQKGKEYELARIRRISQMGNIHFVWQKELNGLGDAITYAEQHVGNEPFAVLLGDTITASAGGVPVTRQLIDAYDRFNESVVSLERVSRDKLHRYGVVKGKPMDDTLYLLENIVEKPSPQDAPSDLVVASRYVFTPDIFRFLRETTPGKNNEIQISDAMKAMLRDKAMYGVASGATRYDIGNKLDFIKAQVLLGVQHDDIGKELTAWIHEFAAQLAADA